MKTLTTLIATLVLLVTVGLRSVSTNFALNEVPSTASTLVDGDGAPGTDGNLGDI